MHIGGQSAQNTRAEMSSKGRQLLGYRIQSEFRYYRKWYGIIPVMTSAGVELLWKALVVLKNSPFRSEGARQKRREAIVTIKTILSTLVTDRFGRGEPAYDG